MNNGKAKPFKPKLNFHIIFVAVVIVLVAIMLWRLNRWNKKSVIVDTDIEPGTYAMECQDYYTYPNPDALAEHGDDGKNTILVIGDNILTNNGAKKSIINEFKKKMNDADIYTVAFDKTTLASLRPIDSWPVTHADTFSLYRITKFFALGDLIDIFAVLNDNPEDLFVSNAKERAEECINTLATLDMNTVDTVIIMYSFSDYFNQVIPLLPTNENALHTYYGALSSSINMLKEAYPFINVVVASPYPIYVTGENGERQLGYLADLGYGNTSAYIELMQYTITNYCTSYIDNYFYVINENNIDEYVTDTYLTDKGIDLITDHMVAFLNKETIQ